MLLWLYIFYNITIHLYSKNVFLVLDFIVKLYIMWERNIFNAVGGI